jgi:hypothetical protein
VSRWFFSVLLCAVACGGAATPPASADDVDSPSNGSDDPDSTQKVSADSAEAAAPEPRASSEAAGADDVASVLQLVIDDEALAPYLRLEQPDRFPLRVSSKNLPPGIELVKATKPVVVVEGDAGGKPVLEFTTVEVGAGAATVRYRYDVENVRGSCSLTKREGRWELKSSRVTER